MILFLSTSRLVRITLTGVAVFVLLFTVSLLPAVLVLPTARYEEVSSFRLELALIISNSTTAKAAASSLKRLGDRPRNITTLFLKTLDSPAGNASLPNFTFVATARPPASSIASSSSSIVNTGTESAPRPGKAETFALLSSEDGELSGKNGSRSVRNLLGIREDSIVATAKGSLIAGSTAVASSTAAEQGRRGHRVSHAKTQGFILAVDYQQQLLGGFKGFYHLSRIAAALNLSIVEPFVFGTSLKGVPQANDGTGVKTMKLSHFYDLFQLRDTFHQCSDVRLSAFETFFLKTSRHVVFVEFIVSLDMYRDFFPKGVKSKVLDIPGYTNSILISLGEMNGWAAHVLQQHRKKHRRIKMRYSFRKSRVILVDARPLHPVSWEEVKETLQTVVREEVDTYGSATIVIPSWRDIQPPGMISSFFYCMPDFPWEYCPDMMVIPHSKAVMNTTDIFVKQWMTSRPVIGVHVRAERLMIDYKGDISHFMGCLQQLKDLLSNGTVPKVPKENVHLFHDLGKYGSQTCKNFCKDGYDSVMSEIYKLDYNVIYFEPEQVGYVPLRKTLAAFVDREYLTRVDVLVTIGRGEYQQNIVERFVKRNGGRRDNLHRICNNHHPIPACYPNC